MWRWLNSLLHLNLILTTSSPPSLYLRGGSHCTDQCPTTSVSTDGQSPTPSILQYQSMWPTTSSQEYHTTASTNGQFRTTNDRCQCWHHCDGHSLSAMPSPSAAQHDTSHSQMGAWWVRCDGATGTAPTCHPRSATNHSGYPTPVRLVCPVLFLFLHPVGMLWFFNETYLLYFCCYLII